MSETSIESLREAYVADVQKAFGDELVSVVEFGETQTDGFIPGRSVVDTLITVRNKTPEVVKRARPLTRKWLQHRFNIPHIFAAGSPKAALDTFPVEYLNLQNFSQVLWGESTLQGLVCEKPYVKLECSHELKSKSVALYQALIEIEDIKADVEHVCRTALSGFVSTFRGLLFLKDQPLPGPTAKVLEATAASFDVDAATLDKVSKVAHGELDLKAEELEALLCDFCVVVQNLAKKVDEIKVD